MKHRFTNLYGVFFFCLIMVLGCGSSSKKDQTNSYDTGVHGDTLGIIDSDGDTRTDTPKVEDLAEKKDMEVQAETIAEDVQPDTNEPDTSIVDIPKDIPTPQDILIADLAPQDEGIDFINPFPDMNGLDPLVVACLQFTADVCSQILASCQSVPFLGSLITDQTIAGCLNLLASGSEIVLQGCQMLTGQLPPEYSMLAGMAPELLQACTANFECTAEKLGKIIDAATPLIMGGGQLDALQILDLIVAICL